MSEDRIIDPSESVSERARRDMEQLLSDLLKTGFAVEPPSHAETLSPVKRKRHLRKARSAAKAGPALSVVDFAVGATRLFGEWRCRALFVFSNDECMRMTERIVDGPSITDRIIQWSASVGLVGREAVSSGVACIRDEFVGGTAGIEDGYVFCLAGRDSLINTLRHEQRLREGGGMPRLSATPIGSWKRMIAGAGLWLRSAGGGAKQRHAEALESFSESMASRAAAAGVDLRDTDPPYESAGIPEQFSGNGKTLSDSPPAGAGITLVLNADDGIRVCLHGDGRNPAAIQLSVPAGARPEDGAVAVVGRPQEPSLCVSFLDGRDVAEPWFWRPSEDPARERVRTAVVAMLATLLKDGVDALVDGSAPADSPAVDAVRLDEQSIIGWAAALRERLALDGLCRIDVDPYSMGQTIARSVKRRYVVGDAAGIESGGFRDGMPVVFADGGEREYRRNDRYASVICPADGTVISLDCRRIREVPCEPAP